MSTTNHASETEAAAQGWRTWLGPCARWLRILSSVGLLVLAGRFSWIASSQASSAFATEENEPRRRQLSTGDPDAKGAARGGNGDLEDLKTLSGAEAENESQEKEPKPRTRHLIVDFGPNRSEVYVNGQYVGRSPFAGQWNCTDGEPLRIEVIPPQGLPRSREAACAGSTISAR